MDSATRLIGLKENLPIFLSQLVQVFFVGTMIGMQRTILPPLAETEFGIPSGSVSLIASFVISFGFVKGAMNFLSGKMAETYGRRRILLIGWLFALPIPFLIWLAPGWEWLVAANILLGINQGFAWSMTVTAKMDIVRPGERGLATGLNEFAGYTGVALAGLVAGYLATVYAPREVMLWFGLGTALLALAFALFWFPETLEHARSQAASGMPTGTFAAEPEETRIFALVTWRDPTLTALNQAGHVEKYVDALIWLILPLFLIRQGASLVQIGWVAGAYGLVWGGSQLWTGPLSDRIGRKGPIVAGMWISAIGVALLGLSTAFVLQLGAAALTGLGMALLYPTIIAGVSDRSHPNWRGRAMGTYRFWRDSGYGIGALLLGAMADATGSLGAAFWFTSVAMGMSGIWVAVNMQETHARDA